MAEPTPLRGEQHDQDPLDVPEALVLNALLERGSWTPREYGLDVEMVLAWSQAWAYCQDYWDKTGKCPPLAMFTRSFPTFEVITGIDAQWAADKLREVHFQRDMRRNLMKAVGALNEGDLDAVKEAVAAVSKPTLTMPKGLNVLDPTTLAGDVLKAGWKVPYSPLMQVTSGGGRGELWYLGARLGQGKSQFCPYYGVVAAEMGARVRLLSLEMPERPYIHRVHGLLARHHPDLRKALRSESETERVAALKSLPHLPGSIEVWDPSRLKMNLKGIEQAAQGCDMLIVDHVGLLMDNHGKKAVEDWRVMAVISNTLKELALEYNIWIFGAAQINREGENASSNAPKVSNLSQSDALGQDGDIVITMKRLGERAMLHSLGKNRWGRSTKWYTRFEPQTASFDEITADQARTIAAQDIDRLAD